MGLSYIRDPISIPKPLLIFHAIWGVHGLFHIVTTESEREVEIMPTQP